MILIQIVKVKCDKCNEIFEREHEPTCDTKCPYCELDCEDGRHDMEDVMRTIETINDIPEILYTKCKKCGFEWPPKKG